MHKAESKWHESATKTLKNKQDLQQKVRSTREEKAEEEEAAATAAIGQ